MKRKKKINIAKKARVRKIPQLELFLRALAELYPRDKLTPGIHLAYLPADSQFYASVKRYNSANPHDFETLLSVKESTPLTATQELILGWYNKNKHAIALRQQSKWCDCTGSRHMRGAPSCQIARKE